MNRYLTYKDSRYNTLCITHDEFHALSKEQQEATQDQEWVWQYANNKDQAIRLHDLQIERMECLDNAGIKQPNTFSC